MGVVTRLVAFAHRRPWWWLGAYLVVTAALYQLAIRAPLYTPFIVEPTALDREIPLLPWTAAPYLTYFALMPSFVWLARRHPERGALLVAAALVVVGNLTINILVPTELAEPLTPERAGGWLLAHIVSGDTPRAAVPSGHLALPLALSILAFRRGLGGRWLFVPWTAVMGVAILTTRQHYLIDAGAALVWGSVGPILTWRLVTAAVHGGERPAPARGG